MRYWSKPGCGECEAYLDQREPEQKRACPEHATYGEGYEAGFEAAMRSMVTSVPLNNGTRRQIVQCPEGMLGYDGGWGATGFDVAVFANQKNAQAAIATAPRWWPKQPWEVE